MTLGHDASAVSTPGPRDPRREDGLRLAHASRVPLGISRDSDAAAVAPSPQGSLERAKQSWCFHVGLTRRTGVTWFWETQSEAVTVSLMTVEPEPWLTCQPPAACGHWGDVAPTVTGCGCFSLSLLLVINVHCLTAVPCGREPPLLPVLPQTRPPRQAAAPSGLCEGLCAVHVDEAT